MARITREYRRGVIGTAWARRIAGFSLLSPGLVRAATDVVDTTDNEPNILLFIAGWLAAAAFLFFIILASCRIISIMRNNRPEREW